MRVQLSRYELSLRSRAAPCCKAGALQPQMPDGLPVPTAAPHGRCQRRPLCCGLGRSVVAAAAIHLAAAAIHLVLSHCGAPLASGTLAFASASQPRLQTGSRGSRPRDARQPGHRTWLRAADEEAPEPLKFVDLKVGEELTGLISAVQPFGCFVDVGADKEGFVPISKISTQYINDVSNFAKPGQMVKVWVESVTEEKLDLSMLNSNLRHNGEDLKTVQGMPPDMWLNATVIKVLDFGLLMGLEVPSQPGATVEGMVHISQITDDFVEHPSQVAEVGRQMRVRVLPPSDNAEMAGRLRLSMRELRPEDDVNAELQDVSQFVDFPRSKWLEGVVESIVDFGVFVHVTPPQGDKPVRGLVHITEVRQGRRRVANLSTEVSVGQEVRVRVLRCNVARRQIDLSMVDEEDAADGGS